MGRPVAIRVSYGPDAAWALRLARSVDKDRRQPDLWRLKTARVLRKVALFLCEAEARLKSTTRKRSGPRRRTVRRVTAAAASV